MKLRSPRIADKVRLQRVGAYCHTPITAVVLMFALVTSVLALGPDELPFGAMYMNPNYSSSDLARLDSMCFNHFIEYRNILNDWRIDSLYNRDMQAVRGGIWRDLGTPPYWFAEPQVRYSWSNYAEIDVDYPYPNEEVRMEAMGGFYSDHKWVSPRDEQNRLSGISTWLDATHLRNGAAFYTNYFFPFLTQEDRSRIVYRFDIHMSIDSLAGDSLNEIVAIDTFRVGQDAWDLCQAQIVQIDTIYAYQCGSPGIISPVSIDFQIPGGDYIFQWKKRDGSGNCSITMTDTIANKEWDRVLFFLDIRTTGEREIKIDKIVISDDYGRNLVVDTLYNPAIRASFEDYADRAEKIYGWHLFDEPPFCSMRPVAHIRGLMNQTYSDWTLPINVWGSSPNIKSAHSYLTIVDSTILNPDIYPFGLSDAYSGTYFQDLEADGAYGPLKEFNRHLGWNRAWVEDEELPDAFWITLQSHDDSQKADTARTFRFPTASDLSCMTYIGLSWGVKGIQYWWYDQPTGYGDGIIDHDGDPTSLYGEIKNHIGPYIQAMDTFYMPLDWDTCYVYNPSNPAFPSTAFIEGVSASSDSYNPDLGWFQFGQYHDPSTDEQYLMILNRACNVDSSTIAPSISVVFNLDDDNLSGDHSYYVIDLARGVEYDDSTQKWQPVPETTYTALMPDGTIPFTTTFRAGEGRLFKIVQAQEKILHGTLDTNLIYQGGVKINGDITVPAGGTFRVKAPARFNIGACDIMHSGKDTTLAEIICSGRLSFIGTENDSIYFANFYDCDATLVTPTPGIWYGIRDCSAGQDSRA